MLIRVRRTRTHPAQHWTSSNPWLGPLEMGVEEEAPNKSKINFSDIRVRWNSLDYWNPSGETGGGPSVATSAEVNTGTDNDKFISPDALEGSSYRIQTAVLQADFSKTNDTLAAVTGWSRTITLEAGKTYRVTGQFYVDATVDSGAVMDFDGGSVTATGVGGTVMLRDDGGLSLNTTTGLADVWQSKEFMILVFDFEVQVNAGGTLIPQLSQQTTHATAATLKKYSTLSAQEVSPSPTY